MAFTVTRYPSDFGNKKVVLLDVTADAAEANINCGFTFIEAIAVGLCSMNSSNIHIAVNSGSTGTALVGFLGISGCTSGDRFFVSVFGH